MGTYINIGNAGFQRARNSEYVDKSGLIAVVNSTLFTERSFSCVTRCRRFGKSMAAKMLCAYYDQSCDSRTLFADLEIASDPSFEKHLNKYPVIYLDMSEFMDATQEDRANIVPYIQRELRKDLLAEYPDVTVDDDDRLFQVLLKVCLATKKQFILIIDEWDAICREYSPGTNVMDQYVNWLRSMFKGVNASRVFAAVYMTGILPIKKYQTQSALNNFMEYSMVEPGDMAQYFGFTHGEVEALALKHNMELSELEKWYDGYQIGDEHSMFNPNSVMQALMRRRCRSFWGKTAAYDTVATYIKMNFEGLSDDIIKMLSGQWVKVTPETFGNDMHEVTCRDDVLTVLIHLGYLSFDWRVEECYVPNREVSIEMENAVRKNNWKPIIEAIEASERLLQSLLRGDAEAVAAGVERVHRQEVSLFKYNDENSMACVISLAFYAARNDFHVHREYQTGDGFADLVLIPRKNVNKPAVVVELKYDKAVGTAIDQIHQKHYPEKVADYTGDILLCGISYDREAKTHSCRIEHWTV
ncbi:MAG: ATP-binding protein [Prevotella sp.]|nr:ATP-binding protein [Prevotella sp.]